jgi:hypothetical protein
MQVLFATKTYVVEVIIEVDGIVWFILCLVYCCLVGTVWLALFGWHCLV